MIILKSLVVCQGAAGHFELILEKNEEKIGVKLKITLLSNKKHHWVG